MTSTDRHYLLLAPANWGHCRPELTLALRLIRLHPHLTITALLPDLLHFRTADVIAKFGLNNEEQARLKVVEYSFTSPPPGHPHAAASDDALMYRFCLWLGNEVVPSIRAVLGGQTDAANKAPLVVIADLMLGIGLGQRLKGLWEDAGLGEPTVHVVVPMSDGFVAGAVEAKLPLQNAMYKYHELVKTISPEEAYKLAVIDDEHSLDAALGNGPMYPWELDPCWSSHLANHMTTWRDAYKVLQDPLRPIICIWPSIWSTYQYGRHFLSIGPQLAASAAPQDDASDASGVTAFLDKCPEKSVLYICFGSEFHPPTAKQADLLFDAIAETKYNVVYISSVNSAEAELYYGTKQLTADEVLTKRTKELGERGFVTQWCDQWNVLGHPAISWFVSHCGSNSAQEAMLHGVPIVAWPGAWDQPVIARQIAHLGIGIELIQTRHNIGKTTATGVEIIGTDEAIKQEFKDVFGKLHEREDVRERMKLVGEEVRRDMESGAAWENMQKLGQL